MARFQFSKPSSEEFWAIEQSGRSIITTQGQIGTRGRSTTQLFDSKRAAERAADRLIADQMSKGYEVLVEALPVEAAAAQVGARYFELVDAKSNKFWEVYVEGYAVVTRYGKIGRKGRTTRRVLGSARVARQERDKLVADKLKKGYVERPVAGSSVEVVDPRNPALEAAIFEDPDDEQAYGVLADWLQQQGDVRGELIALHLSDETDKAQALLDKHVDYFLGPLAEHQEVYDEGYNNACSSLRTHEEEVDWQETHRQAFLWRRGYIHRLRLSHDFYSIGLEGRLVDILDQVLSHPSGRFIVEFAFHVNGHPGEDDLEDLLELLGKKAPLSTRKITLGDNVDQISWHSVGSLAKLWKGVPRLRVLEIETGEFEVGTMHAPALERAVFITGGLSSSCGRGIAEATMPRIQHLAIYYGDSNYGASCSLEDVLPLLARTDLPDLRFLGLQNAEFTDDIADALARAKLLPSVRTLDLSLGTLTDTGAEALLRAKPQLAHLECLDLSDNYLSEAAVAALAGLCEEVITDDQREPSTWDDEPHYYVVVGE